jgi:hypothetical protein
MPSHAIGEKISGTDEAESSGSKPARRLRVPRQYVAQISALHEDGAHPARLTRTLPAG